MLRFLQPNTSTCSDYLSPNYCFPVAHMTPVMLVSFLLLEPAFIIWGQGLYIGSLSPTCLLYNILSSFRSLLRTYLLQKLHFYHSIYFCNYSSPKPDHSDPIYPDLFPHDYCLLSCVISACSVPREEPAESRDLSLLIHFITAFSSMIIAC